MNDELRQAVLDFLEVYYDTYIHKPPFEPKLRRMGEIAGFNFRTWGVRLDTGEWTYE